MFMGFHLLDRQVIGSDGILVRKVDKVELSAEDPPRVVALLIGPHALGERIGGRLGHLISELARRLHPGADPVVTRVPYEQVDHVDTAVHLRIPHSDLPEPAMEVWLREHVINRLPGGHREA